MLVAIHFLEHFSKKKCVNEITKEVTGLWQKIWNFLNISMQALRAKLDQVPKTCNQCVKRGKHDLLHGDFDVTKEQGL